MEQGADKANPRGCLGRYGPPPPGGLADGGLHRKENEDQRNTHDGQDKETPLGACPEAA